MTLLHQAAQKAVEAHYKELGDAWIAFDGSPGTAKRVNFALGMLGFAIDALVAQMSALQQQTEPVAWLVTGGRAYNDRAYIAKDRAELEAVDRRDGSKAVPLYTAPALQHQEVPREPVARPSMSMYASAADYSAAMDGWIATTRQQEARCGSHECKAAQQDGVICADGECDIAAGQRAAAPSTPEKAGGVSDGAGASPAPLHGIAANWFHGEGAIARCSYCSRYSLDPRTLSDRQPVCECGKRHGWSGGFEKPGPDAKWSGKAPAGVAIPLKESDRG